MIKGEGMKMITIQPEVREDGKLPYPFHLVAEGDERGNVGRQDFWKGKPSLLVGFVQDPETQQIDLDADDFFAEPGKARGMHPVMEDSEGDWATYEGAIESLREWIAAEDEDVLVRVPEGAGAE
jgi:hypothetical protein